MVIDMMLSDISKKVVISDSIYGNREKLSVHCIMYRIITKHLQQFTKKFCLSVVSFYSII